jgi:hypothetical protein
MSQKVVRPVNHTIYMDSLFCLQPWGDTMTRRGFWDGLASGCINVVFDTGITEMPDQYAYRIVGDHKQFTITVPFHIWTRGHTLKYLQEARAFSRPALRSSRVAPLDDVTGSLGVCVAADLAFGTLRPLEQTERRSLSGEVT